MGVPKIVTGIRTRPVLDVTIQVRTAVLAFGSTTIVTGGRADTVRNTLAVVAGVAAIVLAGWPT